MPDRLPPWAAACDPADLDELTAAATAHAAGVVVVDATGAVDWSDEAYRLHGRPRWRRVRTVDDVARGLSAADAARVAAAYGSLVGGEAIELLYTVRGETGVPVDVVLTSLAPGTALVERAPYHVPDAEPSVAVAQPAVQAEAEQPAPPATGYVPVASAELAVPLEPERPTAAVGPAVERAEPTPPVEPEQPAAAVGAAVVPEVQAEQAFRTLFDASPSALAELGEDGGFVRVNDAFCRLVGRTWDSLRDTVYEALIHHQDRASALVSRTSREDHGGISTTEHRLVHSDGSLVWVRARTSPLDTPGGERLLVSLENVTAARAREEQLRHDALHDALTGLPNRRLVLDRLDRAVTRSRRAGQRLAVFFVDVDDLKHVNDTHPWGHRAGDVLLTTMAVGMRAALRDTDTIGRLAGDEFLVICEDVGDDVAVRELSERLLESARHPVPLGPQTVSPTVSVGLALYSSDDETAEDLLTRADAAMYVAKSHGGGRVERAEDAGTATVPDLVGALRRGELRMQYQPVVSLTTGAVLGVSAVLRWHHPTLGMLPAHQVRSALDSAAVLPVVDWCIDRAVNDVRTVAPSRVDHVSVWLPVPGRALQATSTRDALRAALRGADGGQDADSAPSLVLDVHEAELQAVTRRPSHRRQLAALAESGPVSLGVEHLSADAIPLGALQLLGAASASLDPELVLAASENEAGEALVRSLVTGAESLGVVTIATGISSQDLLDEARRIGVNAVSGDLIGPAASLEVYSDLLHGERVVLPGSPPVAVVVPIDDARPAPSEAARPVLAAIRALEAEDDDAADDTEDVTEPENVAEPEDLAAPAARGPEDAQAETEAAASAEAEEATVEEAEPAAPEPSEPPQAEDEVEVESAAPPAARLLLGDVVDLAEQVARELGVALPSDTATSGPREATDSAPPQPAEVRRLPGLADLYDALGSPEVSRVLDERTPPSAPDEPPPASDRDSGVTDMQETRGADIDLRDSSGPTIILRPNGVGGHAFATPPTLRLRGPEDGTGLG